MCSLINVSMTLRTTEVRLTGWLLLGSSSLPFISFHCSAIRQQQQKQTKTNFVSGYNLQGKKKIGLVCQCFLFVCLFVFCLCSLCHLLNCFFVVVVIVVYQEWWSFCF